MVHLTNSHREREKKTHSLPEKSGLLIFSRVFDIVILILIPYLFFVSRNGQFLHCLSRMNQGSDSERFYCSLKNVLGPSNIHFTHFERPIGKLFTMQLLVREIAFGILIAVDEHREWKHREKFALCEKNPSTLWMLLLLLRLLAI